MTPFDWQESISQRAQYVESRLSSSLPAVATTVSEGILFATLRRHNQKVFEIYDRLGLVSLGVQADVEALRVGAIEFCHREGYQRSVEDVTLKRLISGLSSSVKRTFSDLRQTPFVIKSLFAELGDTPAQDRYAVLEFDGDYREARGRAAIAGTPHATEQLEGRLGAYDQTPALEAAKQLEEVLRHGNTSDEVVFEAALLSRESQMDRRMSWLIGAPE